MLDSLKKGSDLIQVIICRHVEKSFKGDFIAIIGPSGSEKSTLLSFLGI